jgi:hypothetical protein
MDPVKPDFLKSIRDFASNLVEGEAKLMKSYVSLWSPEARETTSKKSPSPVEAAAQYMNGYIDVTARYYHDLIGLGHTYATALTAGVEHVAEAVEGHEAHAKRK